MRILRMTPELYQKIVLEEIEKCKSLTVLPDIVSIKTNASVKLTGNDRVEVVFHDVAYKKMIALIDECPKEIGWHGIVEKINDKRYEITDILVFPQVVTGSTVNPDETEYTQWMVDTAVEQGANFTKMRFHGHSHVNMNTSPSGVDTNYQKTLTQNIPDFYIFGIFNKKNEWWMNIMDIQNNVLYEKDDINYLRVPEPEEDWAEAEIKKYVKEQVVTSTYQNNYSDFRMVNGVKVYRTWDKNRVWSSVYNGYVDRVQDKTSKAGKTSIYDDDDYDYYGGYWNNRGYGGYDYD